MGSILHGLIHLWEMDPQPGGSISHGGPIFMVHRDVGPVCDALGLGVLPSHFRAGAGPTGCLPLS